MPDEATIARLEQLLEDSLELAEENNKLLKSLQRTGRIAFWAKTLMWLALLVLPFIFLGPLIKTLVPATNTAGGGGGSLFGLPSPTEIQKIIDSYRTPESSQ